MNTELPAFENRTVQTGVARMSGRTSQRVGALGQDEEVIVIALAKVGHIDHANFKTATGRGTPSQYARIHDLKATRMIVLPKEEGIGMFDQASVMADERFGIQNLLSNITEDNAGSDDSDGED